MTTSNTSRAQASTPTPNTTQPQPPNPRELADRSDIYAEALRIVAAAISDPATYPRYRAFGHRQPARLLICAEAFDRHAANSIEMAERLEAAAAAEEQKRADEALLSTVFGRLALEAHLNGTAPPTDDDGSS